jgi:hypothetical protein
MQLDDAQPGVCAWSQDISDRFKSPGHEMIMDDGRRVYYNRTDSPLWKIIEATSDVFEPDEDRPSLSVPEAECEAAE